MSQPGEQTIAICISSSKENQVMKFGQVIEYTMRNLLLEDSYTKCGGETIPRPFSRKSNSAYLWINSLIVCQVEDYCKILKLNCRPLAFTLYKVFLKNKKRVGTSLPNSFSA